MSAAAHPAPGSPVAGLPALTRLVLVAALLALAGVVPGPLLAPLALLVLDLSSLDLLSRACRCLVSGRATNRSCTLGETRRLS
jgi:hypothetical protein